METRQIEFVAKGEIIRFVPRNHRNRVTIRVTGTYDGTGIMGYRVRRDDVGAVSWGSEHAYFLAPHARVEVV